MARSYPLSDPLSTDSDHWLNGFLQQNCEEARKRVQEERKLWNFTDSENSYKEIDLSGMFNFGNDGDSREYDDEILSGDLAPTKPAPTNDGVSIHDDERRIGHDISRHLKSSPLDQRNESSFKVTALHESHQSLNSDALTRKTSANDVISIDDSEQRVTLNAGHTPSADWNIETEIVEVASMGFIHEKQQLVWAINDFNSNVVERERMSFKQTMKQIEETVNEVLAEVERLDSSFKLRRMSPHSFYEVKSRSEVDILVVLENVSPNDFVIEDMKTPTGYARIHVTSSPASSSANMTSFTAMTSALNPTSSNGQLFQWCIETPSGELYFSPKKLCKTFAALVSRAAGRILRNGSSVNRKRVSFSDREASVAFTVNLIPTVACPQTWPLCAYWLRNCTKKWPAAGVKDDVIRGGMHLVALATSKETDPLWRISFCSARRHLFQANCEGKKKCLRLLKVLLDKDLSRPKGLVPLYLENIVLWAGRKHWQEEEWAECMIPERFLEMLVALHKCLENADCYHFFAPTMNLFNDLKPDVVKMLAAKVKDILQDPFKYLKS